MTAGDTSASRGWRAVKWLCHLTVVRIVAGTVAVVGAVVGVQTLLAGQRLRPETPLTWQTIAAHSASAVAIGVSALAAYAVFVRLTERRRPVELALRPAALELAAGAGLGMALLAGSFGVLWLCGAYRVVGVERGPEAWRMLATAFGLATASSFFEEAVMRGLGYRLIERRLGSWLALLISALLFGLAHRANAHATWSASLGLALQAGLLLGAAYVVIGRLWLPIGLHFGWNFLQAGVFGGAVSGHEVTSILQGRFAGPDWLTGGAFGVEGSVVATALCALTAAGLIGLAARRRRLAARTWPTAPTAAPPLALAQG